MPCRNFKVALLQSENYHSANNVLNSPLLFIEGFLKVVTSILLRLGEKTGCIVSVDVFINCSSI